MQYVKLITSDQEVRWINLAQVSRATLADDHGKPLLAIIFAEGSPETKLMIRGGEPKNDKAIADISARLDALSAGQSGA